MLLCLQSFEAILPSNAKESAKTRRLRAARRPRTKSSPSLTARPHPPSLRPRPPACRRTARRSPESSTLHLDCCWQRSSDRRACSPGLFTFTGSKGHRLCSAPPSLLTAVLPPTHQTLVIPCSLRCHSPSLEWGWMNLRPPQ